MGSETQTARYFPYVGAPGWLTKLHQLCIRSLPQRMDVEWLTAPDRLGLSRPNAGQLLSVMQKVGWIDTDGTVLDEGRTLRLVGDSWQGAMRETIQRFYADLLEQIESAAAFTPQDAEQFFVASTNMGHSGRQQMIAVFRWFLREAGLRELEQKVWGRPRRGGQDGSEAGRERPEAAAPRSSRQRRPRVEQGAGKSGQQDVAPGDARLSTIASVLRINIDGTWEESRMVAAFRMLDSLLKGEQPGG